MVTMGLRNLGSERPGQPRSKTSPVTTPPAQGRKTMTKPVSISRRGLIAGLGGIATAATLGACTSRVASSKEL